MVRHEPLTLTLHVQVIPPTAKNKYKERYILRKEPWYAKVGEEFCLRDSSNLYLYNSLL